MTWTVVNNGDPITTGTWTDTLYLVPTGSTSVTQGVNLGVPTLRSAPDRQQLHTRCIGHLAFGHQGAYHSTF